LREPEDALNVICCCCCKPRTGIWAMMIYQLIILFYIGEETYRGLVYWKGQEAEMKQLNNLALGKTRLLSFEDDI
tara:strand:+ start:310 stop:534 length:225 start_codon:yes stop_codon:yes gene_type:complete